MNGTIFKIYDKHRKLFISFVYIVLFTIFFGCTSTKNLNQETKVLAPSQKPEQSLGSEDAKASTSGENLGLDDHIEIFLKPEAITPPIPHPSDSLTQKIKINTESEISSHDALNKEISKLDSSESKSPVSDKIVENYLNSKNKEPGGHCLVVSKKRFENAYEDVHGHSVYEDLPDSMATTYYTPREVFDYLYVSAQGTHKGWRSLPKIYRGKGNAGAIAFAGMGTMVDSYGIWSGELKPGALMQVWKHRKDYEQVVRGVNKKGFDPFGHSFIFIEYVRDEENKIVGIRIADQGYQSYRPLVPDDYEVWCAVNLNI